MPWPWNGGTLATAGNLVFQGDPYGVFRARAADTGQELWSFEAERGILAGPVTFRAGGEQYVAVLAGYGGSMGMATTSEWMRRPPPNGMLLAFKIGGAGALAKLPPFTPRPYVTSTEHFTPAQLAEGEAQYFAFCTICHGGPVNPDLFRSPIATSGDAWQQVVHDGSLADKGMISFKPWLSAAQIEAMRGYVLAEAAHRKAAAE
jgi:mono/diheme cytochrome c family protein